MPDQKDGKSLNVTYLSQVSTCNYTIRSATNISSDSIYLYLRLSHIFTKQDLSYGVSTYANDNKMITNDDNHGSLVTK